MTEIAAGLHATVGQTWDKQTGSAGIVFTTPEGLRLGYFPEANAVRLAVSRLRLSWDNPPFPQLDRDVVVFEAADAFLSIGRGDRVFLDVDPRPDEPTPARIAEAAAAAGEPGAPPAQQPDPPAAAVPSPASQETKRKPIEVRGVVSKAVEIRPKRTKPSQLVADFHILQTEPPPPPDAPDVKVSVFEARGGLKQLRHAVEQGVMEPGKIVILKGYPQPDFVKPGKGGVPVVQRQFNAVHVSPVAPPTQPE